MSCKVTFTKDFQKELAKGRDFFFFFNGEMGYVKVLGNGRLQLLSHKKFENGELDIARKTPAPLDMKFYHTKGVYDLNFSKKYE